MNRRFDENWDRIRPAAPLPPPRPLQAWSLECAWRAAVLLLLVGVLCGFAYRYHPAEVLRLGAWLARPASWMFFFTLAAGIWALGLPSWPMRRPWQRAQTAPFLPRAPALEGFALWLGRVLPWLILFGVALLRFGAWPLFTWPVGIAAALLCERWTRPQESPRVGLHVLNLLEWALCAGLCVGLYIAAMLSWHGVPALWLPWVRWSGWRHVPLVTILLFTGAAMLRQRLRRETVLNVSWLWTALCLCAAFWIWSHIPDSEALPAAEVPIYVTFLRGEAVAAALAVILLQRILWRCGSGLWFALQAACLLVFALVLGQRAAAAQLPLWIVAWLLLQHARTARLKWLMFAAGAAMLTFGWSGPLALVLIGAVVVYGLAPLARPALPPRERTLRRELQTRWFGALAVLLGLTGACWIIWLPDMLHYDAVDWDWLRGGTVLLPAAGALPPFAWLAPLLLLCLALWGATAVWRREHTGALSALLLFCAVAFVFCIDALLLEGARTALAGVAVALGLLLVALLVMWRAGEAWRMETRGDGALLRSAVLAVMVLMLGVCYARLQPELIHGTKERILQPLREAAARRRHIILSTNTPPNMQADMQAQRIQNVNTTPAATPDPDEIPTYTHPALPKL